MSFNRFINEDAKPDANGKAFHEFAKKREMGASKIAENAKEKGGLAMLTHYHFIVKLPYYKKAAAGKLSYEAICKEYDQLIKDLAAGGFNQTQFQKLVGKIEVLGELKLEYEKLNPKVKALNEGLSEEDLYIYEVRCKDGEGTLKEILECIKSVGNTGHSFDVIVDPEQKEGLSDRKFMWDGDGSDYIESIELVQSPEKVDESHKIEPNQSVKKLNREPMKYIKLFEEFDVNKFLNDPESEMGNNDSPEIEEGDWVSSYRGIGQVLQINGPMAKVKLQGSREAIVNVPKTALTKIEKQETTTYNTEEELDRIYTDVSDYVDTFSDEDGGISLNNPASVVDYVEGELLLDVISLSKKDPDSMTHSIFDNIVTKVAYLMDLVMEMEPELEDRATAVLDKFYELSK